MDLKKRAAEWNPADIIGDIGGAQAGTSVFRNIDARILLPAAFVVILALSAAKRWYVPGAVFVVVFLITIYTAPSRKSYSKLLVYPLLIAMFIFIVQAYSSAYGSTVVLTVIWPIYAQGIASGWLYANRVLASVSILLLLVESKSQLELIEALRWFKVPIEIRNLMSLMFRYVSVLSEEFTTMFHAQQARLGFSAKLSWLKKLHNMGIIAGMLVIRSYDRSYRVEKSMMARGYAQNVDICRTFNRFARKDYLAAAFALAVVASIVLVGVVM
jgi:cobalt/nickel transport system permease protein